MNDFLFKNIRHLLVASILWLYCLPASAINVITHKSSINTTLSGDDIHAIFTMRKRYWDNNQKIKVFVMPDNHRVHKMFAKEVLHIFAHQLRRTWNRLIYTGTEQAPITVDSVDEMMIKISNTPYSIGYIEAAVDISVDEAVIQVHEVK